MCRDTERLPYEGEGLGCVYRPRTPKMVAKPLAAGTEAQNTFFLKGLRGTNAADALISDLWPREP